MNKTNKARDVVLRLVEEYIDAVERLNQLGG